MAPPDADVAVRAAETPVQQEVKKGVHHGPDGTVLTGESQATRQCLKARYDSWIGNVAARKLPW